MTRKPVDRGPARDITNPQPGFWMVKIEKGQPDVPACIRYESTTHEPGDPSNVMERPAHLVAYVAGNPIDPQAVWETRGVAITAEQYKINLANLLW